MENASEKIYALLKKVADEMGVSEVEFKVERPKEQAHGDFSSNLALVISNFIKTGLSQAVRDAQRELKRPVGSPSIGTTPLDIAQLIVEKLGKQEDFEKIEVVAPGFINFYLSKKYLQGKISEIILKGDSYGSSSMGANKKASVEFVSANPTGPLHIGNAKGGPLGDTIANVLQKAGFSVTREYLHNDVGGQVERLGEAIFYELNPQAKTPTYEVQYQGEYIKELAQEVKEELQDKFEDLSDEKFMEEAGKIAVKLMLTEILKDCEDMGIKFDKVSKESDLRKEVPAALTKIKKFLKVQDGAEWFAPKDEFLKDRETVVKKSDGQYTYFASDIAYHNEKMAANSLVVDILGSNHSGHVPRLLAVIKALGYDPQNFRCILYQYVRLKRNGEVVKMSKRAGNFVTAREVLDEVGKDAFRFFLLTPRTQTHMDFDLEVAKKRSSDNPVFYVQYAHTRIASIFAKAKDWAEGSLELLKEPEELLLVRKLTEFPYLVEEVVQSLEVNAFVNYALEVANLFHKFYEAHQVISKDPSTGSGQALTQARLSLLKATQITLKNTLDLLGVSAPEKM